jgi:hypothetical protein
MRVLRGFPAQGVVASFVEPVPAASETEMLDIEAPCNAPALDPLSHIEQIAFHTDFNIYEVAIDQLVTLTHPAVPGGVWGQVGAPGVLTWTIYGGTSVTQQVLLEHGLGYVPLLMVAFEDSMVVAGTIVQVATGLRRFVGAWADETSVGLSVCGYSSDQPLPAVERTYRVLVFRTPAPDPSMPLFSGNTDGFQIGRGMVDSAAGYLRRDDSTSPLDMDVGRTIDIAGGGARVVTGGNVQDDPFYGGSFTGSPFIPVNV